MSLENPTPKIYQQNVEINEQRRRQELDPNVADPIDQQEIFDIIRSLKDPEHPLTLEQLHIVSIPDIELQDNQVTIYFTPTIPHCSMALMIGLTISIQLNRCLPKRFKVKVQNSSLINNYQIKRECLQLWKTHQL
ncbi:hypothetical protein pb186bvf_010120 [Paramecium bursaria]